MKQERIDDLERKKIRVVHCSVYPGGEGELKEKKEKVREKGKGKEKGKKGKRERKKGKGKKGKGKNTFKVKGIRFLKGGVREGFMNFWEGFKEKE